VELLDPDAQDAAHVFRGVLSVGRPLLQREDLLDLIERQACCSEVRDEEQTVELASVEEAVAAVGSLHGPEDALFLVKPDGSQRAVGEAGHLAGREELVVPGL
jgi:hypothetical protein